MSRQVGAYVCPRGVFLVECRPHRSGLEVLRSFDAHGRIESPQEAVRQLARVLAEAGIRRASITVALRGFGTTHHVLSFPSAADAVLDAVVAREMQRLEPGLSGPTVAWTRLPRDSGAEPAATAGELLVAAISRDVAADFEGELRRAGHELAHLTALPVAMHRLFEEFAAGEETAAFMAQLADGPFIGFGVGGAIRIAIEPPVHPTEALPRATAFAEEAELGAVFVRQQFRGALVSRATMIASEESWPDLESALGSRLGIAVGRLTLRDLSPGAIAAFGAILDLRSEHPVVLGGRLADQRTQGPPALRLATMGLGAIAVLLAIWTIGQALVARNTSQALDAARRRIDQESFAIEPANATASVRRLISDAVAALRAVEADRATLLSGLTSVANAVPEAVSLDSLAMERSDSGWRAVMTGRVHGRTSASAIQQLNDFYREIPRRAPVESLALNRIVYADTTVGSRVQFEISFGLPPGKRN